MKLRAGAPYEYSRSAEDLVFTAGACPLDPKGHLVAPGDLVGQAERTPGQLVKIEAVAAANP